ncbi:hypothetical protein PEX1_031840 [Penicillium expansum]|uniref:Uncharacterized protein n=1 Tax=Penicillium expansum TaxID=27334 RepID=A0A0A2ICG3_PENEN|nr:hypothetical protein PEX2_054960 [Penicillium expansum]KGO40431.1 hypothetical protein PEXP_030070 [Penicillium expansum]KGO40729.1 hypothetical protein PEX1_031840 [Penicillium expansum]KGO59655.1 hypothetical protein PEX2_054960 [Penicillium expansum]
MADFIMPRTACEDLGTLSSDKKKPPCGLRDEPAIYLTTLWCLQCFRYRVRNWDRGQPFDVVCTISTVSPQMCTSCKDAKDQCDWIPQGIRGHVFELMALIQFLEEYWGDNYDVYEGLRTVVCDLCAAFDHLVETHRKAHMLTGNVSEKAKAGYSAWCNAREHTIRPSTQYTKAPHHKYAVRATEHLRLRMGEEASISWAAAICAFKTSVKEIIREFTRDLEPMLTSAYINCAMEQFPLEIPEL